MHFKTLVTVCMPTVEEDPHENAAVVQSIELLQDQKKEQAKNIMARLRCAPSWEGQQVSLASL